MLNYCMLKRLRSKVLGMIFLLIIFYFSGGMKRRVSLAIAAIGDPKIIFLDEPTTGLDPKTRRGVWKMIKNLKKNRVIVLTTHDMEEAEALSDRITVIAGG